MEISVSVKTDYIIAFTGHRPTKIGGYDPNNPLRSAIIKDLTSEIRAAQIVHPNLKLISGGALGIDQDVANIAITYKIPFILACPCYNMDSKWPVSSQKEFRRIADAAEEVVYVHNGPYNGPGCLQKRNEWMVDHCDELIAVWDGSTGGTHNCVKYAAGERVKIYRIDPNKFGILGTPIKS